MTKNQLLFFKKDEVYVIVSGSILMKNHQSNLMLPQTFAKFSEGDILNYKQEQSEIFNSIETWFFCQVDTEIAVFSMTFFESLWKDLLQYDKLVTKNVISCHPLFKKLNELTLMNLVYELLEVRKFKKGDVLACQSKSSPTNVLYKDYYNIRLSKIAQQIKKRKRGGVDSALDIKTNDGQQSLTQQKSEYTS